MDNLFLDNLRRQAEENPLLALAVGGALITAVTKLLNASSSHKNSNAWAREVERRIQKSAQ